MSTDGSGAFRSVLRNSAVLAVAKLLERATGFVVALIVAAQLGADGLGTYAAALAIYGLIAILGDAGLSNYLVREVSRAPERTATYLVHVSIMGFGVAVVCVLAGQLVVPLLGYSDALEQSVAVVLFSLLPRILNSAQEAVFVARGRVGFEAVTRLFSSVSFVVAAVLLLGQDYGVPAVLGAMVVSEYVVAIVYFMLISRFIARLRLEFDRSFALRIAKEIRAFAASSALGALFARPEVVVLSLIVSEREVGLYAAALRLAELPGLVPEVVMTNVFPLLSKTFGVDEERFLAWQEASVRAMLAFSLPVAACLIAGADVLVRLFGEEFAPAAPILRLLAINLVLFALIGIFWRSLMARRRQNAVVAVQSLTSAVRVGGAVLLAGPLGALGAAISFVATALLHLALLAHWTARSGARPGILRAGWRFVLAAALSGLAVWVLGMSLPLIVALVVGAFAYVGSALALGAVTPEDRALVRALRASRTTG